MWTLKKALAAGLASCMLFAQPVSAKTMIRQITAANEQTPAGDEGTVLSPVITVGSAAEKARQAEEAESERQAKEAALQAEEAERQAEEAARQAEEAARQTEETAQQAAGGGRYIDPSKPMIALTFDDGPMPSVGNRIMDCLAQYNGRATFFLVGDRVPAYADEVRRMAAEGHEIANHTMNHKYLQKLGAAEIQSQVNQCNNVIESVCGVRPTVMRLPGGSYNAVVLANTNMPMIQWNNDTLDWKTRNAQSTVDAVLGKVKDGDIVLMHELYSQTGDAALQIIPALTEQGYQLVTVSEMAAAKGVDLQAGKLYSSLP